MNGLTVLSQKHDFVVGGIFVCHKILINSQFSFNKDKEVSVESSGCFFGSVDMKDRVKQTAGSAVIVYFPNPYFVIRYHCCLGEAIEVFLRHWSLLFRCQLA